jgi:hypothetical protein
LLPNRNDIGTLSPSTRITTNPKYVSLRFTTAMARCID